MSLPPVEIPLGAMRFNSDSQKLEYFNGQVWMQVHTFNPDLDGGGRACFAGNGPSPSDIIDYITISNSGNAIDFGNLTGNWSYSRGVGGSTRGLFGQNVASSDTVEYITFSTTGNAIDFGNLTANSMSGAMTSSATRVVAWQGTNPSSNTISYATIASTGNFVDFGDMVEGVRHTCGMSSPTRGFNVGGWKANPGGNTNIIQYVTTATLGNALDFGDVTIKESIRGNASFSSSTRGVYGGGIRHPSGQQNTIEYITMSSTGNGVDFGDVNYLNRQEGGGTSSCIKGIFAGGYSPAVNTISQVAIPTTGDAVDFGDLTAARAAAAASNCHGGLG